jgi:hypothetical protein
MALNHARLDAYLSLERNMLRLDDLGDQLADRLRDAMDPIWHALTDEEHALLDARTVVPKGELFIPPPRSRALTIAPPVTIKGWAA